MSYNDQIKKTGLKKTWIADRIGISNVMLSYYINGTRDIPEDVERKLKVLLRDHLTQIDNGV